ncbi:uncharacterized protein EV422DRAFT_570491 [Fimicolochytrium jonesii]|uniref:uncharacterized protein n=1 Tax=Fimicolochytrium jonesii TaxID=1396493 RepID=UPI0022FEB022|nr:uncharacterized protein EV422DRAFT_570491 [Fimicolochytrium jonesii]KAI8817727.1 hypothetical protein EV422DRAFT_570491 [Fimicolochytrium jonesii]
MAAKLTATLAVLVATTANLVAAQKYPFMPTEWPSQDQNQFITGRLLEAPLILDGMKKVQAAVPENILALPVAEFHNYSNTTYPGCTPSELPAGMTVNLNSTQAQAACWWPSNNCIRTTATSYYQPDIVRCKGQNVWGLTYDDGPTVATADNVATRNITDILGRLGAKATFFVAGSAVSNAPGELRRAFSEGHEIAVHTWTHHPLTTLTNAQIVAEILYTEAKIYSILGVVPRFFRPPYGDVDDRVRGIISALGYLNVIWTTEPLNNLYRDTRDAEHVSSAADMASVVTEVEKWFVEQPGFISLEHDINPNTSTIAINLLSRIESMGPAFPLKLKPIGECYNIAPYMNVQPGQALPPLPEYRANPTDVASGALGTGVGVAVWRRVTVAVVAGLVAVMALV